MATFNDLAETASVPINDVQFLKVRLVERINNRGSVVDIDVRVFGDRGYNGNPDYEGPTKQGVRIPLTEAKVIADAILAAQKQGLGPVAAPKAKPKPARPIGGRRTAAVTKAATK